MHLLPIPSAHFCARLLRFADASLGGPDIGAATFDALEPTSLQTKSSMDEETITVDTISDDSMSAMHEPHDGRPTPDSTKVKLIGQNGE